MSDQSNRLDPIAGLEEPPDDGLAPEERVVPMEEPNPEEYEPTDPDVEAIVDGGSVGGADDPDAAYPHAGAEEDVPPTDEVER